MDVLDLEVAHPALLLRHEIRQRKRRDRPGEDHLDLGGARGGCIQSKQRCHYTKALRDCTQSNMNARHDRSPAAPEGHRRVGKMGLSDYSCK
jgi:hypothetical protein